MQAVDIKTKMQSLDYRQYKNSYLIRSLLFSMTSGGLTSSLCTVPYEYSFPEPMRALPARVRQATRAMPN